MPIICMCERNRKTLEVFPASLNILDGKIDIMSESHHEHVLVARDRSTAILMAAYRAASEPDRASPVCRDIGWLQGIVV
jgi:hypothetical protein